MKNTYIPLAPTKDMYFSSAWFGRWKVPFTEIKKKEKCPVVNAAEPPLRVNLSELLPLGVKVPPPLLEVEPCSRSTTA
jgi:hypothetical protein